MDELLRKYNLKFYFKVQGCENSYLFESFSEHVLHRLRIHGNVAIKNQKLRITFLSRKTKYRKVLNEDELIDAIKQNNNYEVQKVEYGR